MEEMTKDQRIKYNKERIEALPETMDGFQIKLGDEMEDVVVTKFQGTSKAGRSYTRLDIDCESFPKGNLSIFLPLMGAAGFVPDEDEVRQILSEGSVYAENMIGSSGTAYSANLVYDPLVEEKNGKFVNRGKVSPVYED